MGGLVRVVRVCCRCGGVCTGVTEDGWILRSFFSRNPDSLNFPPPYI